MYVPFLKSGPEREALRNSFSNWLRHWKTAPKWPLFGSNDRYRTCFGWFWVKQPAQTTWVVANGILDSSSVKVSLWYVLAIRRSQVRLHEALSTLFWLHLKDMNVRSRVTPHMGGWNWGIGEKFKFWWGQVMGRWVGWAEVLPHCAIHGWAGWVVVGSNFSFWNKDQNELLRAGLV